MGGAYPGVYPPMMRITALAAIVVLAFLAYIVLAAARGKPWAVLPAWGVALLMALGLVMNLLSPSAGERALWSPVVAVLLACALRVAWPKP